MKLKRFLVLFPGVILIPFSKQNLCLKTQYRKIIGKENTSINSSPSHAYTQIHLKSDFVVCNCIFNWSLNTESSTTHEGRRLYIMKEIKFVMNITLKEVILSNIKLFWRKKNISIRIAILLVPCCESSGQCSCWFLIKINVFWKYKTL